MTVSYSWRWSCSGPSNSPVVENTTAQRSWLRTFYSLFFWTSLWGQVTEKCFLKAVHLKVNYFQGPPWWESCVLSWPIESFLSSLRELTRSDLNLILIVKTSLQTLFLTVKGNLGNIFWGMCVCMYLYVLARHIFKVASVWIQSPILNLYSCVYVCGEGGVLSISEITNEHF